MIFSFFWVNITSYFRVCTATHVLQFSSGTVSLNFVWLSHNALSLSINLLIVAFYLIHYPYFVWTAAPFCLFFWVKLFHPSLCEFHTNTLCIFSLMFVSMSHMRVSIFFVWMSHKYLCVSITFKWTLHFVSFYIITDPFSFLPCVNCHTSFLKWKIHLTYLFSQFW